MTSPMFDDSKQCKNLRMLAKMAAPFFDGLHYGRPASVALLQHGVVGAVGNGQRALQLNPQRTL
jgi:hypothetical protein